MQIFTRQWLIRFGVLWLFASSSVQAQVYRFVYRVDTRPPDEVFANGLNGEGQNFNLLEHALGGSCAAHQPERQSAWLSTTADFEQARAFAAAQQAAPGESLWLYSVQTDSGYLDIADILGQVIAVARRGAHGYRPAHAEIVEHLLHTTAITRQVEVVTQTIRPRNIFSAVFVGNAQGTTGQISRNNPHYQPPTTDMDNQAADLQQLVPATSLRAYQLALSCFQACDAPGRSERRRRAAMPALHCAAEVRAPQALVASED